MIERRAFSLRLVTGYDIFFPRRLVWYYRRDGRAGMIDFEEELKKFEPSMEVEEAEDAIHHRDLTDMTDLLRAMTESAGR